MKKIIQNWLLGTAIGLGLAFSVQPAFADKDNHEKHEHKSEYKKDHKHDDDRKSSKRDRDDDDRNYSETYGHKGMDQRYAQTGKPLPPGWQKKMRRGEVMDREVYDHGQVVGPVDIEGRVTIRVDGKLIRLYQHTREIIDILN